MKRAYYIILAAVIALICILLYSDLLDLKDIGTAALALVGTFAGATFAFRLNEDKEKKETSRLQRQALNRALLILLRQYNALAQLEKDFRNYPDDFTAAFNMPAMKPPNHDDLVHNISDLEFLIDSDNPNILMQLTIEQERFHQALDSLRLRNEFYVGEVQLAISAKAMNGMSFTPEEAKLLLGDRIFGGAINSAKNAREHIVASRISLATMASDLRIEAKKLFPDQKFLMYEISDAQAQESK